MFYYLWNFAKTFLVFSRRSHTHKKDSYLSLSSGKLFWTFFTILCIITCFCSFAFWKGFSISISNFVQLFLLYSDGHKAKRIYRLFLFGCIWGSFLGIFHEKCSIHFLGILHRHFFITLSAEKGKKNVVYCLFLWIIFGYFCIHFGCFSMSWVAQKFLMMFCTELLCIIFNGL